MSEHRKAWKYNRELVENSIPFPERAGTVSWDESIRDGERDIEKIVYYWGSNVTDSLMPLFFMGMLVQEYENLGYDVSEAEKMLEKGIELNKQKDRIGLYKHTVRLQNTLFNAPKNLSHDYWKYPEYDSFEMYAEKVKFPEYPDFKISYDDLYDKILAGWLAQVSAGAVGTAIEGFHTKNIEKVYGWVDRYLKTPEMYNDDLTFQFAFLEVFQNSGYDLKSSEIAEEWAARIPVSFTAEEIALRNIKNGIFPPESGYFRNPYRELIGAQMRAAVCGMVAPGNPKLAAELAWKDAIVSHHNNAVLSEVFNAVMVSLGFVEDDAKKILEMTIDMMPKDSKFYSVLKFAWDKCEELGNWRDAWLACDEEFKKYGWIHSYPNSCAQVVSIYFCNNDYDTLVENITMCGLDIDSSAAQVANVIAVMKGTECLSDKWIEPIGDRMETYVRGMETIKFNDLAKKTTDAVMKHNTNLNYKKNK